MGAVVGLAKVGVDLGLVRGDLHGPLEVRNSPDVVLLLGGQHASQVDGVEVIGVGGQDVTIQSLGAGGAAVLMAAHRLVQQLGKVGARPSASTGPELAQTTPRLWPHPA